VRIIDQLIAPISDVLNGLVRCADGCGYGGRKVTLDHKVTNFSRGAEVASVTKAV